MINRELRAVWSLGIIFSLRMLGMFMVLPVLSTYGMSLNAANKMLIGLAIGIYGFTQAMFQIPFGLISDYVGRKPIIIIGLLIFSLGSAVAAFSYNIWGVILGRALQGSGAINAVAMALLADLTSEDNRIKAMAFIGASFGITFLIALVVSPIVTNNMGLHGLFWTITSLAVIGLIIAILVVPTSGKQIINREFGIIYNISNKILKNVHLLRLNISIFLLHTLLISNFITLPSIMAHAGFFLSNQWKVYLFTMLISFTIAIPTIIYAENKRYIKFTFLNCILLLLIAELMLFMANNRIVLILTGIQIFFLAFNIMEILLPSLISKESPAGYKGTAMGIYSTSQFFGVACGGSFGGFLLQFQNSKILFLAGAALTLIWFFISTTMNEPCRHIKTLRIILSECYLSDNSQLLQQLQEQPGVAEVVVILEEHSIYLKINTEQTSRAILEKIIFSKNKK